jgi:exopolyphosphatase/guanosine-5'-triphosphate,3'-diphosphate pyrophosphatase
LGPQEVVGSEWDYAKARKKIDKRLADVDLKPMSGKTFYAVGGAWRALAQIAFAHGEYPLRVVHGFALETHRIRPITRLIAGMSQASLLATPGVSRRRAASLPYAALLLRRLLKKGRFSRVVFSAYGLREGVIAASLPPILSEQDPLIAGAEALARPVSPCPGFGRALAGWIEPLMTEIDPVFDPRRTRILQESAARLADLGARMHPDHRVDLARDSVLYAPFAGVTHPERAFLAAMIHHRYGGSRRSFDRHAVARLIDQDQRDLAQLIGMALRLGAKLSGRSEHLLSRFRLSAPDGLIRLDIDESVHDLYVERSVTLLDDMAAVIGRNAKVVYG